MSIRFLVADLGFLAIEIDFEKLNRLLYANSNYT